MRGRYTIIHYQMHLKAYSIQYMQPYVHQCSLKSCLIFLFLSLKILCNNISAFQNEDRYGLYGYNNSYMSFFCLYFTTVLNEFIVCSRKKPIGLYHGRL